MKKGDPLITQGRGWKNSKYIDYSISYMGDVSLKSIIKLLEALTNTTDDIKIKTIKLNIDKIKGNFAFIINNKDILIAAVDRIKSIPIFIASNEKTIQLGNHAAPLAKSMHLSQLNNEASLSLAMSGYTLGDKTIVKGLSQLLAGEFFIWENKNNLIDKYYNYTPWNLNKEKKYSSYKKELKEITLDIISSILKNRNGETIAVPLSGGFDSRLIISALFKLKAKNVLCYSYGRKNNFEANIAKIISKKLNYPWYFVPLDHSIQRKNFSSPLYDDYVNYADTLSAFPYVQDLFVVDELLKKNVLQKNSIIINGNSGDFITGGHIPSFPKHTNNNKLDMIINSFITKHCSLWLNCFSDKEVNVIKNILKNIITKELPEKNFNYPDFSIFEYLEFMNRQTKYVIPGQRIYEFLGLQWKLPLWDDEYLKFWSKVPYDLKLNQKLYSEMLYEENWGNVWKDLPVNKKYITPKWVIPLRLIAKSLFAIIDKELWKSIDKKYFSYWMEIIPHFSTIPYNKIIFDKRNARNAVSWHTELYLNKKGLDGKGSNISNKLVL